MGADRRLLNVDALEAGRCRGPPCSRLSFHAPFLLLTSAIKLEAGGDSWPGSGPGSPASWIFSIPPSW